MGVEFFEEKKTSNIPAAAGKRSGFAGALVSAGLTKSVTGAHMGLAVFGMLCLFGAYFVYSLSTGVGVRPPTQAEIRAMADLLRK